jgi:substrate import-associated zinc metallohydrolase lipoprotein
MNKSVKMKMKFTAFILTALTLLALSCSQDETLNVPIKDDPISTDTLDQWIQTNFTKEYGIIVRYKIVDNYVETGKRVTPADRAIVEPALRFVLSYWMEPFISVPNGNKFFRRYVPAEIVLIGSPIFNGDGTITLGTADAGARITLTQVNDYDPSNKDWIITQIHTIYHEFAHIMHQNFKLPATWKTITPHGYTGAGAWYTLSDEEALELGFVTPYATSSYNEDFAETVAEILFNADFYDQFVNEDTSCSTELCAKQNAGRALIKQKYDAILAHYKQYTGVDLLQIRDIVQQKLQ